MTDLGESAASRTLPGFSWHWLLVLFPLGVFLVSGWRGADFGSHWDQGHRVSDLASAFEEQNLLPDEYNYPSMTFWLTALAASPEAIERPGVETEVSKARFSRFLISKQLQIRCRLLFLLISSLAILWVFAASLAWRNNAFEALFAACFVAGSFEVGYHSRWVAPDAILMQFGALCLFACLCAVRKGGPSRWTSLALVAAGLAAGTKYTGGIFLLPALVAAWHSRPGLSSVARGVLLFAVTFLITTPGLLFEPSKVLEDIAFEMEHYADGHLGYSVEPGWTHFIQNLRYLFLAGPSTCPWLSQFLSVLGLLGIMALWRESRMLALVLLLVPVLFVPYISSQKVMFVRNLIPLMPVAALLSARGLGFLWESVDAGWKRGVLAAGAAVAVFLNFGSTLDAGASVRDSNPAWIANELEEYLIEHPDQVIQLSPRALAGLQAGGHEIPANARTSVADDAQYLVLYRPELRVPGYWPSNNPGFASAILGPLSANYDYYGTWWAEHLLVLEKDKAHAIAEALPLPDVGRFFPDLESPERAKGASVQSPKENEGTLPKSD
ncbi:MAG: hypothetical protein ACI9F9_001386 [Candidatus Paceibacteria bacterium]|jgi:hypothetical protein